MSNLSYKSIFILCLIVAGCSITRTTNIYLNGKDIKSPYATGDGEIVYNAVTKLEAFK
jgi:hypothetical protein